MKTQEFMTGTMFGTFLFGALLAVLFGMPAMSHAHAGVTHTTDKEAVEHFRDTTRNIAGSRASSTVDITCMAEAIDDREDALMDAWADMSSSTMAALEDRRDGLMDAWGKTTMKERNAAIVKMWKEWRTDKKTITAEFRKDRKAAWDAFKKTAKEECKMVTPKDENLEKATSDSIAI